MFNVTLVSGSGITLAYLFLTSAPGGSSSGFTVTTGIRVYSSSSFVISLTAFASPAKFMLLDMAVGSSNAGLP
uniref:Secreted protein n=1 Tax=Panstrongylus lignarius TaxID=156445 RepID=A0A224Y4G8_9HEMI